MRPMTGAMKPIIFLCVIDGFRLECPQAGLISPIVRSVGHEQADGPLPFGLRYAGMIASVGDLDK
jgi:hypothetical protein